MSYRTLSALLALAWHPNVAVKAIGRAGYAENAYRLPSLHDKLRAVYDVFGPTRIFCGTDIVCRARGANASARSPRDLEIRDGPRGRATGSAGRCQEIGRGR